MAEWVNGGEAWLGEVLSQLHSEVPVKLYVRSISQGNRGHSIDEGPRVFRPTEFGPELFHPLPLLNEDGELVRAPSFWRVRVVLEEVDPLDPAAAAATLSLQS